MKSYKFQIVDKDIYKVTRIDEKKPKGDKERYKEYLVTLLNGDAFCDCKYFYFSKKSCKHIKFILGELTKKKNIIEKDGEL